MKFSDEILMAYADGELDEATRAAVESAMRSDARIAQQIESYRAQRNQLQAAFDDVLDEPVPDRLLNAARVKAKSSTDNVIHLSQARPEKFSRPQSKLLWPVAASLLIGLIVGKFALHGTDQTMIETTASGIFARGSLDTALSAQLASDSTPGQVKVGLSFRAKSGEYCRTFSLPQDGNIAGVACRDNDQWRMHTLAQAETSTKDSGSYRMAGTALPPSVLRAIEENIAGEPLDADAETAAKNSGWKK